MGFVGRGLELHISVHYCWLTLTWSALIAERTAVGFGQRQPQVSATSSPCLRPQL